MPPALDWLGVPSGPPTSYLSPAIPYRTYGLTAQDAVMQGEDALGSLRSGAAYADILRQQQLAPLQQQVSQQQLQNQATVQPQINAGREDMIKSLSALNPASESYLAERRNAVMQNPYGLADPIVQEVLRTNDRAYDDYLSTRRVEMMGSAKPLTVSQQASIQKQISQVTESLAKANMMGDTAMTSRYTEQLQALTGMLSTGSAPAGVPDGTASPQAFAIPGAPEADVVPTQGKFNNMAKDQRWTTAKELVLDAVEKEAAASGKTREEVMQDIGTDDAQAKDFFRKHLKVDPDTLAFEEKTNPWYGSGYGNDMSWQDVFTSLQGDRDLLHDKGIVRRKAAGLGVGEPSSFPVPTGAGVKGNFTIRPK